MPDAIYQFLIKTSILSRFCAPLCEAVTGLDGPEGDSQMCLAWLEHNNVFFFSMDAEQRWFRYHHLFQKLLFDQLRQQLDRAAIDALHVRASAWFAQNDYPEEALRHALAADDTAAASQIFAHYRRELTNDEEWHRLHRWLHLFPQAVIDQDPELLLSEVWFLINRQQLADVPSVLDRVETLLAQQQGDPSTVERLQGEVDDRRATQYYYAGDYVRCLEMAQQALTKIPTEWWMLRAHARMFLGVAFLATGELKQAYAALYDSDDPDHGRAYQMRLLAGACFTHWMAADLSGVAQAAALVLKESDLPGSQVETTTWARYHLGIVQYQQNDLAAAEQQLAPLIRQRYRSHVQCFLNGAAALALVYQAQNRPDEARTIAELMGSFALEIHSNPVLYRAKAFQAELAFRQGRMAEAKYWAEQTDVSLSAAHAVLLSPVLTYVRILIADDAPSSRRLAREMLTELNGYHTTTHNTSGRHRDAGPAGAA